MKGYFYHRSIRKYILLMGNLFGNIYVARNDEYRKVPVTFASKEKFIAAINSPELNGDKSFARIATSLPRISIDLVSMTYDSTRKTNPGNRKLKSDNTKDRPTLNKQFNPTPYDLEFEVGIFTRHQDDAFQIIEQIIPYFQPMFNTMIKELDENEIVIDQRDIPIALESCVPEQTYEGAGNEIRHIEWTLNLRLKGWLYPPTNAQFGEIRTIYLNFNDEEQVIIHSERESVDSHVDVGFDIRGAAESRTTASWRYNVDSYMEALWERQYTRLGVSGFRWDVRDSASNEINTIWNTQSYVVNQSTYGWNVTNYVTAQSTYEWDIRDTVTSQATIPWSTREQITEQFTNSWDVRELASSNAQIEWSYYDSVNNESQFNWEIQDTVSLDTDITWDYSND